MCYRPITILNPATKEYMQVPCGKCLDCLRKYQNQWSIRMYEEYKARGCRGVFFTLTYDEAHVPKNYFVDGEIIRSYPDYGFGNVHPSPGYGVPKCAKGVRKKYAVPVHACLADAGLLRDGIYEQNQDILDFNSRRSPSKHTAFLKHIQHLFADYFALCSAPSQFDSKVGVASEDFNPDWIDLHQVADDFQKSWFINEDTGELIPRKAYFSPEAHVFSYRERPIMSFNSVRKEDVQLWINRNRTRFKRSNPDRKISYFITSEYGPTTLRPHYHGCIFGVTADEIKSWFKDWQIHYGEIVVYEDLDMSKGGLSYVSKYCSKGSFEHPLCAKDFFYFYHRACSLEDVICSEYHSKHYEKCIQWFGVDKPIVDPTFHLVSKGLGVAWCEKDIPRCKEFEDIYTIPPVKPEFSLDELLETDDYLSLITDYINRQQDYEEKFKAWSHNGATLETWLQRFSERCKYKRHFVSSKGEQVFAYALPKFYREKMFGHGLRSAYSNFVRSRMENDYRAKLPPLEASDDLRACNEVALALEAQSRQELVDRFNRSVDKFKKFYNKSKL